MRCIFICKYETRVLACNNAESSAYNLSIVSWEFTFCPRLDCERSSFISITSVVCAKHIFLFRLNEWCVKAIEQNVPYCQTNRTNNGYYNEITVTGQLFYSIYETFSLLGLSKKKKLNFTKLIRPLSLIILVWTEHKV